MNVLILSPHWPPSNLAGAQRVRLIANGLNRLAYNITVVTVDSIYYEESLSMELRDLVDAKINVTACRALPVTGFRLIGDIGLRGFYWLYQLTRIKIQSNKIDLIWVSIPSFYTALIARMVHATTGIDYVIDYIDPWVRTNDHRKGWRFKLSNYMARWLEPLAVARARWICGVSEDYYTPVLRRNFVRKNKQWQQRGTGQAVEHFSFPYGFDQKDYELGSPHFKPDLDSNYWYFAGAFMPKSRWVISSFLKAVALLVDNGSWSSKTLIQFDGTGYYEGRSIISMSQELNIGHLVRERRERVPYLQVLANLEVVDTVLLMGSTEQHYTPSKVFQQLLSERPILGALNPNSTALSVLEECNADEYIVRLGDQNLEMQFAKTIEKRLSKDHWRPNLSNLNRFSVESLARSIDQTLKKTV